MTYNDIADIKAKKNSIRQQLISNKQEMSDLWDNVTHNGAPSNRIEMIANVAGNAWTILDGLMLVRKLFNLRTKRRRKKFF